MLQHHFQIEMNQGAIVSLHKTAILISATRIWLGDSVEFRALRKSSVAFAV